MGSVVAKIALSLLLRIFSSYLSDSGSRPLVLSRRDGPLPVKLPGANRQKNGIGGIARSAALIQAARVRYGVPSGDDLHRNLALR